MMNAGDFGTEEVQKRITLSSGGEVIRGFRRLK